MKRPAIRPVTAGTLLLAFGIATSLLSDQWAGGFFQSEAGINLRLGTSILALLLMVFGNAIEKLDKRLRALESEEHVDVWSPTSGPRPPEMPGPDCHHCGTPLRTAKSKQCMNCGSDRHPSAIPELTEAE